MSTLFVTLRTVSPRPTAVVVRQTTWDEFPSIWSGLLDEVYAFVRSTGEHAKDETPRWQNVMLYRDDQPTVEVGVLVPEPVVPSGRVIPSALPGGNTAMSIHRGPYGELGRAHDAVHQFVKSEGLELAGPRWEIYGHWREDPRELETEVYYLLR